MKIVQAERIPLNIPFYCKRATRAMQRAQTHDERVWRPTTAWSATATRRAVPATSNPSSARIRPPS